jgi:hypothetical protein
LTSALDGGEWSASCAGCFAPGKSRWYPLDRELGGTYNVMSSIIMSVLSARTCLFVSHDSIVLLYLRVHTIPPHIFVSTDFLLFRCLISFTFINVDVC